MSINMAYAIIGGYLEIDKTVFTKEMLGKNSRLRKLLKAGDLTQRMIINRNEDGNTYIVDFTQSPEVEVEETYQELFRGLKVDYPGRIKGKVTIRMDTPYRSFFTEIVI